MEGRAPQVGGLSECCPNTQPSHTWPVKMMEPAPVMKPDTTAVEIRLMIQPRRRTPTAV